MNLWQVIYSNITFIIILIIILLTFGGFYTYVVYYTNKLSKGEDPGILRRFLYWVLIVISISTLVMFLLYVSLRIFKPLGLTAAMATVIAANAPATILGTSSKAPLIDPLKDVKDQKISDIYELQTKTITVDHSYGARLKKISPLKKPREFTNLFLETNNSFSELRRKNESYQKNFVKTTQKFDVNSFDVELSVLEDTEKRYQKLLSQYEEFGKNIRKLEKS